MAKTDFGVVSTEQKAKAAIHFAIVSAIAASVRKGKIADSPSIVAMSVIEALKEAGYVIVPIQL